MIHPQELSKCDLQAVKIQLGQFLGMLDEWDIVALSGESLLWGDYYLGNKSQTDPSPSAVLMKTKSTNPAGTPRYKVKRD